MFRVESRSVLATLMPALVAGSVYCCSLCPAAAGEDPERARADQLCASYGQGFVAGHAPGQCVKVQERLRIDPNGHRGLPGGEDMPTAFAPIEDGPLPARLRLNGGFGAAGPADRTR
jgi:hypothetical protein